MGNIFSSVIFITVAVVIGYGTLEWLQIPKGTLTDWIVGLVSCWWLIVVVVMPWNVHFSAKEVLDEIKISRQRNMKIDPENEIYAQKITKRYLIIAISLHIISAIGLALLTFFNVTVIGYWGAIVALLLMGLRLSEGIDLAAYRARWGSAPDDRRILALRDGPDEPRPGPDRGGAACAPHGGEGAA